MSKGGKHEHEREREGVWGRRNEGTLEHERERTLARRTLLHERERTLAQRSERTLEHWSERSPEQTKERLSQERMWARAHDCRVTLSARNHAPLRSLPADTDRSFGRVSRDSRE